MKQTNFELIWYKNETAPMILFFAMGDFLTSEEIELIFRNFAHLFKVIR